MPCPSALSGENSKYDRHTTIRVCWLSTHTFARAALPVVFQTSYTHIADTCPRRLVRLGHFSYCGWGLSESIQWMHVTSVISHTYS